MNIKNLLREDDAVSPVIGVILMVAITVILAAVIGTFVLGLGDQVQSSAPNANFQFEYEDQTFDSDGNTITTTVIQVSHNGGQDITSDRLNVLVDGNQAWDLSNGGGAGSFATAQPTYATGNTISTGTTNRVVLYNTGSDAIASGNQITIDTTPNPNEFTGGGGGSQSPTRLGGGEDVRIVWTSPNGDSSNTIGQSTVPN